MTTMTDALDQVLLALGAIDEGDPATAQAHAAVAQALAAIVAAETPQQQARFMPPGTVTPAQQWVEDIRALRAVETHDVVLAAAEVSSEEERRPTARERARGAST